MGCGSPPEHGRLGDTVRSSSTTPSPRDAEGSTVGRSSEPLAAFRRTPPVPGASPGALVDYSQVLEHAADGILISDANGVYVEVNHQACAILGFSRDELLSMAVSDLIHPDDLARLPIQATQLSSGESVVLERQLNCADGSVLPVDVSARKLDDGHIIAIIRDISKRKSAETRLNDYMELLDTIRGLQSRFISQPRAELIFELMLRSFLRQTKSEYGFIGEVARDEARRPFLVIRSINSTQWNAERRRDIEAAMEAGLELRELDTLFGSVLLLGAPVISNDPIADPRHSTLPPGHPSLSSFMALPLYVGGRLVGCVGLVNRDGGYPSAMPDLLEPLATTCGSLIEGLRVRDEGRRATELAGRLGRILDQTSGEILVFSADDLRFVEANRSALDALGFSLEELCERTLLDLLPHISREHLIDILDDLRTGQPGQVTFETMQRNKAGQVSPVEVRLSWSKAEAGLFVAIVRDITERKQVEGRLSYLVHYDALTGLPNRLLLADRLEQALREAEWDNASVAVLSLDVDRFKAINDTLGHQVGDQVLGAFAERLKLVVPRGGTLARLGGDEFIVVVGGIESPEDAARVAQRILELSEHPLLVDGREFFVTSSVGITLYPEDAGTASELMQRADTALHAAKRDSKASYQFFTAGMQQQVADQLSMETQLRRALERGELTVVYQPKVRVRDEQLLGAEALVRWTPEGCDPIPPSKFITLAEETGLIVPIGRFVLVEACQVCAAWQNKGFEGVGVSVNLSLRQIRPGLFVEVSDAIERAGLRPELLELELTESALMRDPAAVEELRRLQSLGIRFALDDFGTGYSSLTYIKRFNVDTIKIDRSFVAGVTHSTEDAAIARAIVAMAHSLGLDVVAEGVETTDQLLFLAGEGCDAYQGYYFSEPLTTDEFAAFLEERGAATSPYPSGDAALDEDPARE